ncbi:MAG: DNA adenine methylase [Bacteroidota bacterium]
MKKEKMKIELKTPISYYGGKQSMLKHILPIIPEHEVYVEPFFGGGAVFWGKEPVKAEIVNDYNGLVVNFYEQLSTNFEELKKRIDATPYSRDAYKYAMVIYHQPYLFSPVVKAWAFWVGTVQGFSNQIGSWRCSQTRVKESLLNFNKKGLITKGLSNRLNLVQIENMDAVKLILSKDTATTFFYVDPPYVDACQGHYGGYTQEHFNNLLNALSGLKGKFLLSSYPNEELLRFRKKYKWFSKDVNMALTAANGSGKRKVECLTANYAI